MRNRTEKTGIGFGAEVKSPKNPRATYDLLKSVEPEDLINKYGLIPEFVGRMPVAAAPSKSWTSTRSSKSLPSPRTRSSSSTSAYFTWKASSSR